MLQRYSLIIFWFIWCIMMTTVIDVATCEELMELSCSDDMKCHAYQHSGIQAHCDGQLCHCKRADGTPTTCQPQVNMKNNIIGGPCPCAQPNSECNKMENKCYCALKYTPSDDRRRCLPEHVPLNEPCETTAQCRSLGHQYIECNTTLRKCVCPRGYLTSNLTSQCIAVVGEEYTSNCTTDIHCHKYGGPMARCERNHGKCICAEGHVIATNQTNCIPAARYGTNCTENRQCHYYLGSGGLCLNGLCQCAANYYYLNTEEKVQCQQFLEFGKYCRQDDDCYQHHLPSTEQSMHCKYAECDCKEDYNVFNNTECTRRSFVTRLNGPLMLVFMAAVIGLIGM